MFGFIETGIRSKKPRYPRSGRLQMRMEPAGYHEIISANGKTLIQKPFVVVSLNNWILLYKIGMQSSIRSTACPKYHLVKLLEKIRRAAF
ncbi:hypothetical protein EV132_10877 [Rhizobium sullae]|uniref:Uncharacterized protein n=1 Tax=Rhizobium sullae TaxID=50338 RepID=A0A4R3Q234_RHISU|nr:hypothetical protein EV132_10877 [Rhizobium sullae]